MDQFKQISTFVDVAARGSLSATARAEGIAPAVIGRRLDALEARLGVKLLQRTTRKIALTHEGLAFLENCQRILLDLENAETQVSERSARPSGHLLISAPAGLGIDVAIRIADLSDSSLVGVKLADNKRVVVGSPEYFKRHGRPASPDELSHHNCLAMSSDGSQRGWTFRQGGKNLTVKVGGNMGCNDGAVLHDWALAGRGLAWRSMWEVGAEIEAGLLETVLDEFAAPGNDIYAVFAQRQHLPLRIRAFVDFLRRAFAQTDYWRQSR